MAKSHDEIWDEWDELVNMSPKELEDWLETEESKSVGQGEGESKGHKSGRRIVDILRTNKGDLSDDDWDHMGKVVGYIKRHGAQVPDDPEGSDWTYSMKNWGHDPFGANGMAN